MGNWAHFPQELAPSTSCDENGEKKLGEKPLGLLVCTAPCAEGLGPCWKFPELPAGGFWGF